MKKGFFAAFLICSSIASLSAFAGDQVGTLTQLEGEVKLFTDLSKTLQKDEGDAPRALFEGEYYRVRDAKIGDRVEHGNIVRTALTGKVKVVYENGDQFAVGPGTSYRIFWDKDAAKARTQVKLLYGKLRGIVAKGGPRSKMQIRTKTATMGVRGTDFFIAQSGADDETEVSILRGSVEVKPEAPKAKSIQVSAGYSATVAAAAPAAKLTSETKAVGKKPAQLSPAVELRKTTQEELTGIQKSSVIEKKEEAPAALPPEVAKTVAALEVKAVETTLRDIKHHDPKLFAQLQTKEMKSTEEINTTAVQTLMKTAPKAPEKRKPFKTEMENLDQGAYERFFKVVE